MRLVPSPSTNTSQRSPQRPILIWGILAFTAVFMIGRMVFLQMFMGEKYKKLARLQQTAKLKPFIPRLSIVDRRGSVLAIDQPAYMLYAYPQQIKLQEKEEIAKVKKPDQVIKASEQLVRDRQEFAKKLADILEQEPSKILAKLESKTTSESLGFWLPEKVADRVRELIRKEGIAGLELVQQRHRLYPQEDGAAEVIGFVDIQDAGKAGIEQSQDKILSRQSQEFTIAKDGYGRWLTKGIPNQILPVDRTKLQLTIDLRTQQVARQALGQQMAKYGAKRGAVMVMDANNGELRALVTLPTYNPNQFWKAKPELFRNWAVSDLYEPGSTFKPINVAIALETESISPDTTFYDEGKLIIGGWPVANFDYEAKGVVGVLSISQILQRSSNVGMVHIISTMKAATYYDWLERIGLGESSKVDLPTDMPSVLKSQEQFISYAIEPATAAFGQGFSLTPIQLLQLQGILASGGKLLTPHVVRGIIDDNGTLVKPSTLPEPRQIFSPGTTTKVLEMMQDVVELGTGKVAKIPGYRFGGKTGTSQKAGYKGYTSTKITSFVGIFPTQKPRYVVLAVIDEPVGDDAFGSTVAAPIVKQVLEDLIVQDGIPPSHPQELGKN
jgi:cell division protein FtsI (penicillin-binding protein 3)